MESRRDASYAQLIGTAEDARLARQNEALRFFDGDVYRRVLGRYDAPVVLEVGCATGDMIAGMTEGVPGCRVFGFDRVQRQVDLATRRHPEGTFAMLDVEGDSFVEDVRAWMGVEGVAGFDVISCSMVVMHLSRPEEALCKLRTLLAEGGTLVVREVDDGLQLAFPDPEGRFGRLFEIFAGDRRMGDRHCGRKVPAYLRAAGFSSVRLERQGLANISLPDGLLLYEMAIPAFLDYARARMEREPDCVAYREDYEWFAANIDAMRACFERDDFLFSTGFISYTAM